jgi:uncharacterized protein with PQ loop repeat
MYEFVHFFRKRRQEKRVRRFLDVIVYPIGLIGIVMAIPQLSEIWIRHNADGVSPISWAGWSLISLFWINYGFYHKERPILILNSLWFLINLSVSIGAFIYG